MTTTRIDERTVLAETPDPSVDHDLGRATKGQMSDAGQITTIIDEFLRTGIDEVLVGATYGARGRAWPTSPRDLGLRRL